MRLSSDGWWLLGSMIAAVGIAPLMVQGDTAVNSTRDQSRQILSQMNPAERQRLDENFERYRQLPPEERARLRTLHEELSNDRGGAVRSLDIYSQWRRALSSAFQREDLRNEQDVEKKIALIAEFEAEREAQASRMTGWWRQSRIKNNEFYQVMDILRGIGGPLLTSEDQSQIDASPSQSPNRVVALIQKLRAHDETFSKMVNESTLHDMVRVISDRDVVERPESRPGDRRGEGRQEQHSFQERLQFMRNQLYRKISGLLWQEGMQNPPSDATLEARLVAASPEERETYYSLAADQLKQRLRFDVIVGDSRNLLREFFEPEQFGGSGGRGRGNPDGSFDRRERRNRDDGGRPADSKSGDRRD